MDSHTRAHKLIVVAGQQRKPDSAHKKNVQPAGSSAPEAPRLLQPESFVPSQGAGDLSMPLIQHFATKIQFKGEYRSELWPRQKIVTTAHV
jgi:hypothetical protein